MYDDLFPSETERSLEFRARNPEPPKAPKASIWGQAAELAASPFKGTGQAGLQTLRVANTATPMAVGNPLAMTASEQEDLLQESGITRQSQDQALRGSIESLRPDPVTATAASRFLQEGSRVVSKALFYGATGGPAAAIVGTGVDEGITGAQELRDRGVDPATAAKVGVVRGVTMGASVAMPVIGQTALRTAGLVVTAGPGLFIAEQSMSREILERADYPEIAREYDPFDPVGLSLSMAVPGVVGLVMHRARARAAAGKPDPRSDALDGLARDSDLVDAALVAHRTETVNAGALGDVSRPDVSNAHARALDAATQALDEGRPVHLSDVVVDPEIASQRLGDAQQRMAAARAEVQALEPVVPEIPRPEISSTPAVRPAPAVEQQAQAGTGNAFMDRVREVVDTLLPPRNGQAAAVPTPAPETRASSPEVKNAMEIASRQPDLPVRLDDDGSTPQRASDLMDQVRKESQRDSAEARKAFEAAVQCFIEGGA
jgi:hypothetical protein